MSSTPRPRLWEIDTLRGIAVVAMMFFHFMWDLWYLGLTTQNIAGPDWQAFARSIGGTFTFLLGLSLVLSTDSLKRKGLDPLGPTLKRGLMIFGFGLVISVGTYFFAGNEFVRFGILHHAGAALILGYFFVGLPAGLVAVLGAALIALGAYLNGTAVDHPWLIPFGVIQRGVGMVDYYPLLPWFGVALLGIAAGKLFYAGGQRRFALPDLSGNPLLGGLRWLGRNSLAVYLIHQPVLIGVLLGGRALGLW